MSVSELDLFKIFHEKDQQYHASAKISHVYNDVKNILQTEEFMPDQLTSIQNCWKKYRSLKKKKISTTAIFSKASAAKYIKKNKQCLFFYNY